MKYRLGFASSSLILMLGICSIPFSVRAVGVSPSLTVVENMANGIDVERIVTISRSDTNSSGFFTVGVSGEGAKYIYLPKNTVSILEGQRNITFPFHIRPVGATNGEHTANLIFTGGVDPKSGGGANAVSIISGVIAKVSFVVTDQEVKDIVVTNLAIDDSEIGQPLTLIFSVKNTGNVDIAPDRIDVTLADVTDSENVIRETISGSALTPVEPGRTENVSARLNQKVPLGEYLATAVFYLGGKEVYKRESLRVFIWPAGTLNQSADFSAFTLNGNTFEVGDLIKINATIANNGQIGIEPTWYVDVKRNGKTVDVLRQDKKTIGKGSAAEYFLTFRPEKRGAYTFDAYFEYGIKKTESKKAEALVGGMGNSAVWFGVGGVILIILIVIVVYVSKHRLSRQNRQS